jgi:hypothetical protein
LELKKAANRGNTILDEVKRMNFLFIYGCRPSTGVKANTTMIKDIYGAFISNADIFNFTV